MDITITLKYQKWYRMDYKSVVLLNNKQDLQRAQYPVTQVWRPFLPVRPNGVACGGLSALSVRIYIQIEVQVGLGIFAARFALEPRGNRYLLVLLPPT